MSPLNNPPVLDVTYYDIAIPALTSPGADATWEAWDLSSVIPAGAKTVDILLYTISAVSICAMGVRKNGGALARLEDLFFGAGYHSGLIMTVELDAGRIIERYSQVKGDGKFTPIGYWI